MDKYLVIKGQLNQTATILKPLSDARIAAGKLSQQPTVGSLKTDLDAISTYLTCLAAAAIEVADRLYAEKGIDLRKEARLAVADFRAIQASSEKSSG